MHIINPLFRSTMQVTPKRIHYIVLVIIMFDVIIFIMRSISHIDKSYLQRSQLRKLSCMSTSSWARSRCDCMPHFLATHAVCTGHVWPCAATRGQTHLLPPILATRGLFALAMCGFMHHGMAFSHSLSFSPRARWLVQDMPQGECVSVRQRQCCRQPASCDVG